MIICQICGKRLRSSIMNYKLSVFLPIVNMCWVKKPIHIAKKYNL